MDASRIRHEGGDPNCGWDEMPLRDHVVDDRQDCSRVAISWLRDKRSVRTCELIVYPVVAELQLTSRSPEHAAWRPEGRIRADARHSSSCAPSGLVNA
jgi:hypothetical protein